MKARWLPALVAAGPILAFGFYAGSNLWLGAFTPALGLFGVTFVISELVRSAGRRYEKKLLRLWDGFPTTRALRFRTDLPLLRFERQRKLVEGAVGYVLPSRELEDADPIEADAEYATAVRTAIARVRAAEADGSLLRAENASYGFRRNARAIKPIAVAISLLSIAANVYFGIGLGNYWAAAGTVFVQAALLLFWIAFVTNSWVEEQAENFTERFFTVLAANPTKSAAS